MTRLARGVVNLVNLATSLVLLTGGLGIAAACLALWGGIAYTLLSPLADALLRP